MHKIVCLFLSMFLTMTGVCAETITKTITNLGINKSAVSVSLKSVENGSSAYALNEKTPRVPASTLKLITSSAAVDTLGKDYVFSTKLYKSTNNDLYLKLSGDPLLSSNDLEQLITTARDKQIVPKTFYIDDSVYDHVEWGEGWQWDDELNPLMPKFSAYNLNKNLVKAEFNPTSENTPASIKIKPFYPYSFMNLLVTKMSEPNSIKIEKNNSIAPNMINVTGTISKMYTAYIPVNNPQLYFILQLESIIADKKFEYFNQIKNAKLPDKNVYVAEEINHELLPMLGLILKSSNNLVAESVYKQAGFVWSKKQGTAQTSLDMLMAYLEKINVKSDDIRIVDGSGVSKNNLMTSDFMTDFLVYKASEEDFGEFKQLLPAPGEGTLKNRMLYLKNSLYAKTGTLSDTSAIAGYITTRRGKTYAFDIMINDPKTSTTDKKNIEEQILRNVYANY